MTLTSFDQLQKTPAMVAEDLGRQLAEEQIRRMGQVPRASIQGRVFALAPALIAMVTASLGYKTALALAMR